MCMEGRGYIAVALFARVGVCVHMYEFLPISGLDVKDLNQMHHRHMVYRTAIYIINEKINTIST